MKSEQIQKAVLEDKEILSMQELRKFILSSTIPTYELTEKEAIPTIDEKTKLHLTLIDKAILSRIEQITNFYNR